MKETLLLLWCLALSLAFIPVYQPQSMASEHALIEQAYGAALEKIFLVYCENLAVQDESAASARFRQSLARIRQARTRALEIADEH